MSRIDHIYVSKETANFTQSWKINPSGGLSDHRMTSVEIIKKGLPYIGKGLWKLHPDMLNFMPYTNRIRKTLLATISEMKQEIRNGNRLGKIWTKRKKEIQNISMEETTKRKRTIGEEQ
jgi:hypothetical protein